MTTSIKQHFKNHPTQESIELKRMFAAVLVDMAAQRAAFVALTAKMDADFADVSNASTDYAATVDPAALTLIA